MEELISKMVLYIVSLATSFRMFSGICEYGVIKNDCSKFNKDADLSFTDGNYNIVRSDYISGKFSKLWGNYKDITGWMNSYCDDSRDCDNYAVALIHFSHMIASKNNGRGFPVAYVVYVTDEGICHAINAFYTNEGIKFYEPQQENFIKLSKSEKESISQMKWFG